MSNAKNLYVVALARFIDSNGKQTAGRYVKGILVDDIFEFCPPIGENLRHPAYIRWHSLVSNRGVGNEWRSFKAFKEWWYDNYSEENPKYQFFSMGSPIGPETTCLTPQKFHQWGKQVSVARNYHDSDDYRVVVYKLFELHRGEDPIVRGHAEAVNRWRELSLAELENNKETLFKMHPSLFEYLVKRIETAFKYQMKILEIQGRVAEKANSQKINYQKEVPTEDQHYSKPNTPVVKETLKLDFIERLSIQPIGEQSLFIEQHWSLEDLSTCFKKEETLNLSMRFFGHHGYAPEFVTWDNEYVGCNERVYLTPFKNLFTNDSEMFEVMAVNGISDHYCNILYYLSVLDTGVVSAGIYIVDRPIPSLVGRFSFQTRLTELEEAEHIAPTQLFHKDETRSIVVTDIPVKTISERAIIENRAMIKQHFATKQKYVGEENTATVVPPKEVDVVTVDEQTLWSKVSTVHVVHPVQAPVHGGRYGAGHPTSNQKMNINEQLRMYLEFINFGGWELIAYVNRTRSHILTQAPQLLSLLRNPTEAEVDMVLGQDPSCIRYVLSPTRQQQEYVISKYSNNILLISNPCEDIAARAQEILYHHFRNNPDFFNYQGFGVE